MSGAARGSDRVRLGRRTAELAVAALTTLFGLVVIQGSLEEPVGWTEGGPGAGAFPLAVGILIVASSLGTGLAAIRDRRERLPFLTDAGLRRVAAILLPTLLAAAAMPWLGLYLPSIAYVAVIMRRQGGYRWPFALLVATGCLAVVFVTFELWFQVPLAKGPLEAWLGLD